MMNDKKTQTNFWPSLAETVLADLYSDVHVVIILYLCRFLGFLLLFFNSFRLVKKGENPIGEFLDKRLDRLVSSLR